MSGLLVLHPLPHEATQPLKSGSVNVDTPMSPCAPPKLGCSFILDTVAVMAEVGLHVPSGGGGEGGGGGGGDGEGGGGEGGGGDGGGGLGGGGDGGGGLGLGGGGDGGGDGERYETTAVRCGCNVTGALPSRPSRTQSA